MDAQAITPIHGEVTSRGMKRRGILAAAGAVVAAIAAKQAGPVGAANGDALTAGNAFTETAPFSLTNANGTVSAPLTSAPGTTAVFRGTDGADAVRGLCWGHEGIGVFGISNAQGIGVVGTSDTGSTFLPTNVGVYGQGETFNAATIGVFGQVFGNSGTGVAGDAATGVRGTGVSVGVTGIIPTGTSPANSVAIQGMNQGTGANGIGVYGLSTNGTGMYGQTSASNQYGILGATYATNSTAVAGTCIGNGSSAFSGGTTNPNAYAGVFQGNVVIQGRLVVSDPSYKSGALQHPDGSTRLVYCVESPESWIEDVGKGQLANGTATVTFDPDFAAVVRTDTYHVFLTEYDGHNNLCVANRAASGFEVHAASPGASGTFSWKVMVKAKSGIKSERLGKFTMPNLPLPDPSRFKAPETPTPALPKKP